MKQLRTHGPRLRSGVSFLAILTILLAAGELAAQEPPPLPTPPDTAVVDTLRVELPVADSLETGADSLARADSTAAPPPEVLASFAPRGEPGWQRGVWSWDREALSESAAVTLTDLLERIPGVTPIRAGFVGAAEAASAFGAGAGRIEVILDGFALDPLEAGTYDFSRLELNQLESVRVERRLGGLRIEIRTLSPSDPRPYTVVEAGTGDMKTNLFRGIFLTPRFLGGPLSLGVEHLDTQGNFRREPATAFTGWAKWGLVSGNTGLELEMRRGSIERLVGDSVRTGNRQDWILRARSAPFENVTAEGFIGFSANEDDLAGQLVDDKGMQAGFRAGYHADRGWAHSTVRLRDNEFLPSAEVEVAAGIDLPGRVHLSGDLNVESWKGEGATSFGVRAEVGPWFGVRPFAEASFGRRGVPYLRNAADRPVFTDQTALRVGADASFGGLHLGVAGVRLDADSLSAFGLPFDRVAFLYPGGIMDGIEITGRVPLLWEPLALEGWYTRWAGNSPWIYLPDQSFKAALVYRHSPLESGNLDLIGRLEGSYRGQMRIPTTDGTLATIPGISSLDLEFQVRVIDVRAFVRWNNILHRLNNYDVPGRTFPGQHVFYGVKWQFWN